jgi:cation diffusion facilitator family transporter
MTITYYQRLATPEASTKLSLVANVLLLILKFIGGFWGGSKALIADCFNSFLDLLANAAVLIGIKVAQRPADAEHQYGHGNADVIAASLVAVIIFGTGMFIGYDSAHSIIDKAYKAPHYLATAVAAFTIILKTFLYRFTIKVGIKYKSPAVFANAQDHKSDVYASSGALAGIIFAQLGYPILDPIGGVWVSFFIMRNGVKLIQDNIHTLMSGAPNREIIEKISITAGENNAVKGIVATRVRTIGAKLMVDLEIFVDKDLSVLDGHTIAHQVRDSLLKQYDDIIEVMVHVEPNPD